MLCAARQGDGPPGPAAAGSAGDDDGGDPAGSSSSGDKPSHQRRVRYQGQYPRKFSEKYKELSGDEEVISKVLTKGRTPAGQHVPICVEEILSVLSLQRGETVVDATLGYGGHSLAMVKRLGPFGRLVGLDADPLQLPKTQERLLAELQPRGAAQMLTTVHTNFRELRRVCEELGLCGQVDGLLADLGVSSMQLDDPSRGFSFKFDGTLDLRLDPTQGSPAWTLIRDRSDQELKAILEENADEPRAHLLAQAMVRGRRQKTLTTTRELSERLQSELRDVAKVKDLQEIQSTIRRCFQALRIEVNREFEALDSLLAALPHVMAPGGRVAILTFHSGEDRRVKRAFKEGLRRGVYCDVAKDVIRPSPQEVFTNPRAKSAKLRWAVLAAKRDSENRQSEK